MIEMRTWIKVGILSLLSPLAFATEPFNLADVGFGISDDTVPQSATLPASTQSQPPVSPAQTPPKAPASTAASQQMTAAQNKAALAQLQQLLSAYHTYQANFAQVTLNNQGKILQKSSGRVYMMRPGGFRWETDVPTHQIIITDGRVLWIYDIDLAQATKQPFSARVSLNPAVLLSGSLKDLMSVFTVAGVVTNDNTISFTLIPIKSQQQNFTSIMLTFQNKVWIGMQTVNNLDQRSVFTFTQVQVDTPLAENVFSFTPPPNVDVVEQKAK